MREYDYAIVNDQVPSLLNVKRVIEAEHFRAGPCWSLQGDVAKISNYSR